MGNCLTVVRMPQALCRRAPSIPYATSREHCTTGGLHPSGICEISAQTPTVVSCSRRRCPCGIPESPSWPFSPSFRAFRSRKVHPTGLSHFRGHSTRILHVGIHWRRPLRRRHLWRGHCQLMPTNRTNLSPKPGWVAWMEFSGGTRLRFGTRRECSECHRAELIDSRPFDMTPSPVPA